PAIALVVGVIAGCLVAWALWTSLRDTVPERHVSDRPIQITDRGYTSSDTCKACHPREYATWRESYHRTMTQVATPETVLASFDGVDVKEVPGRPMSL